MKKFLIATTAVVALAGTAAADVSLRGDAKMGMKYDNRLDDNAGGTVSGWNQYSRARVHFDLSGETDSGLSFGATFRADQAGNAASYSGAPVGSLWAEGAYGRLAVGDVDSAIESAVGDLAEVGLTGLEFYNEIWYSATAGDDSHVNNNKGITYSYTYGDVNLFASLEDQYDGVSGDKIGDKVWSIGAAYTAGNYSAGIGYSQSDGLNDAGDQAEILAPTARTLGVGKVKTWGVSASGDFNGFTVKGLFVQAKDDNDKLKQYGISGAYAMPNGVSVAGYYRQHKWDSMTGKEQFIGLGANYDLGGGAELRAGVVRIKDTLGATDAKRTIADFGLNFTF